jgi:hypothetical protein
MLSIIYDECHKQALTLSVINNHFMLSVINKPFMLNVVIMSGMVPGSMHAVDTVVSFAGDVIYDRKYFYNIGHRYQNDTLS